MFTTGMSSTERPVEAAAAPSLDFQIVFLRAFSVLTDTELAYFLQVCQGKSYREIGKDYNVSHQAVNDAYKKAIAKLKS
jgi:predicted DNA-binding protein YlxM (UPF0122 family)